MANVSIRITDDLYKRLKDTAQADLRSINREVTVLLEEALAARARAHKLVNV